VGQILAADRAAVPRDAPLLSVVDLSRLEVQLEVPESFARDLTPGVAAELSGNGGRWSGSISGVSPEVVNGQVVARVRFTGEPPPGLRQNQHLSVRVLVEQRDDVLTVERGSLTDQGGYAYRVVDGIATRVPVRLGSASIGRVEVLEGLAAGDHVVVSGTDAFDNADRVMLGN
jgi:HlyD family secretion protein